jgi:putative FmdB family regulatory protein
MPLYEYTCLECGRRYTWLVGVVADPTPPTCDRCGAVNGRRKEVSRFARLRSEGEALDALADPDEIGDPNDPATMRKWMREIDKEMGEGMGDDFDEYVDAAASGQDEGDEA